MRNGDMTRAFRELRRKRCRSVATANFGETAFYAVIDRCGWLR
jgi:hypothetical protein